MATDDDDDADDDDDDDDDNVPPAAGCLLFAVFFDAYMPHNSYAQLKIPTKDTATYMITPAIQSTHAT